MSSRSRMAKALRSGSRIPEVVAGIATSPDWATLVAAYVGAKEPAYPLTFRTRAGQTLVLETFFDLVTAWIIFFRREYRVLPSDRVILDVGGNIGTFSVYAAGRAPGARIVALEPFPKSRARLVAHVGRNGLADRVACRPWGLSGRDESRTMPSGESGTPSQSLGLLPEPGAAGAGDITIECVTLGTLFERERLAHVDFMKMDIEGGEHDVLSNTPPDVLARVRRIGMEYHPNGSRDALVRTLGDAGFDLVHDAVAAPDSGVAHFDNRRPAP